MSKKVFTLLSILMLLTSVLVGCGPTPEPTPISEPTAVVSEPTAAPVTPPEVQKLILATTTSTENSGLLGFLLPLFEEEYGVTVEVIAVGTGQALKLGEDGNADVLLVHARAREDAFMDAGHGVRREDVMYNDFIIVGPADDPAGIKGMTDAAEAFAKIAEAEAMFISRGDDSGTHTKEKAIWAAAGVEPSGDWYVSAGQGMGAVLTMANEQLAYTLSDRATYLARTLEGIDLVILTEGDPILFNPYGVIAVNPDKNPEIHADLANQFIDWLVSLPTQEKISQFGVDEFGSPLFTPDSVAWREAHPEPMATPEEAGLEGKLIAFHAGSLTVPMDALTEAFQAKHPGVTFETEASGSNAAARKISELGREADLMMSADYTVIDKLLIPDFADWNIQFARNTMVIAYTDQSQYADEINSDNWYEILTRDGVIYGHSEPDADPCGYRTLLVWQLAEKHYGVPGLYEKLDEHCPPENVRPKSVELIVLLESGDMDYAWEYRSVAVQHGMEFVELPDEINLSMVEHADFYSQASVDIAGKEPGTTMTMTGSPIVYGVTIPKNAPSPDLAIEFVKFLLGPEGQAIMEGQGQPPIVPAVAGDVGKVPDELKDMVEPPAETAAPQAKADLNITGAMENELALTVDDLKGMGVVEITAEHPKKGQETYQRVRLNDLLDMAKPKAEAATLSMVADDGYSADVALSDAQACTDCLVALQTEGGLRTVMPGMPSNVWVKGVIEIAIK